MKHIMFKKNKTVTPSYRQRGASLLEGIAYLGIAAVVVIGAVALMRGAFSNAQSNGLMQDVISLRTNIRKLYMGQGGTPYAAIALGTLISAQAFPDSVATNAANVTATNTWNGAITVAPAVGGAQFTITYQSVPQDVCVNALSGTTGWVSITVTGAAATQIAAFPAAPAAVAAACSAANNTIAWTAT